MALGQLLACFSVLLQQFTKASNSKVNTEYGLTRIQSRSRFYAYPGYLQV